MKEKWRRLNKISAWSKEHTFFAMCAFAILVCILICISFAVYSLCSDDYEWKNNYYTVAEFSDEAFEMAVREALLYPEGDLYQEDLYAMTALSLTNKAKLSNIEDISMFPNLVELKITGCSVHDILPISSLHYLEKLVLYNNHIKNIEPLCSIGSLNILDVSNNNISQIPNGINNLYNLKELYISNNRISDISSLLNNDSLMVLYLRGNKLTAIPDLTGMELLQIADFGGNAISSVAPMSGVKNLIALSVDSNCLNNIDFLQDQLILNQINLSYNDIEDISVLTSCLNLQSLALYGEEEFDLSPLHGLKDFNSIYLDQCFDRSNIDFMIGNFKTGDKETIRYLVSKANTIEYTAKDGQS